MFRHELDYVKLLTSRRCTVIVTLALIFNKVRLNNLVYRIPCNISILDMICSSFL